MPQRLTTTEHGLQDAARAVNDDGTEVQDSYKERSSVMVTPRNAYIEGDGLKKESWLFENGRMFETVDDAVKECYPDELVVGLILEDGYTKACIAYNAGELSRLQEPGDLRRKLWFTVAVEKLHEVSPELKEHL